MKDFHKPADQQKFIDELKARQQNLIWPNTLVNNRGVDAFFLKGSPNPTVVQRIAAWLFGLAFMALGCLFLFAGKQRRPWFIILLGLGLFALGTRIFLNGRRGASS